MQTLRNALCVAVALCSAPAGAQYAAPLGVPMYCGCGGIYLDLARQNDDLLRIRARLRRLELETDQGARARQWIDTLDAENRNLRQQNVLYQRRVLELEAELKARKDKERNGNERNGNETNGKEG
jgi:hypothetical protein